MAAIAIALLIPLAFVAVDEHERRRNPQKTDVIDRLVRMWRS